AITKTLLRTEAKHGLSPEEVLSRVNDTLVPDNDACMFVTIFCAVLDVRTGKVEFSNGGHNPPLVLRAGTFEYMQVPKGFVVGAMEGIKFTKGEYTLDPGDVIFLYTDGVTEAMNPEDELFSEGRLKEYFSKLTDRSVEEIVEGVKDEIKLFVRDREQSDDITMLALKFRGKRR
ncbi:MAG TPA: serine/threonine-protein phosphatase, partial [Candidatus Aerophobetes bacterium]|nr:serine/threonine-protein phosphatase [Candidatus Aerophobetes bacterium]